MLTSRFSPGHRIGGSLHPRFQTLGLFPSRANYSTSAGTSADMQSQKCGISARPDRSLPTPASSVEASVASAPVPSPAAIPAAVVHGIAIGTPSVCCGIAPSVSSVAAIASVAAPARYRGGRHHSCQGHNGQNQRANHQCFLHNSPPLYAIQLLLGVDLNTLSQDRSVLLR